MRTLFVLNTALLMLLNFAACDRHSANEVYAAFGKNHSGQKQKGEPHHSKERKTHSGVKPTHPEEERENERPRPNPPRFFPQQQ